MQGQLLSDPDDASQQELRDPGRSGGYLRPHVRCYLEEPTEYAIYTKHIELWMTSLHTYLEDRQELCQSLR